MKYVLRNAIVGLTLLGCFSAQAGGAVKISAQVDSSKDIYIGENFTYYIIIEGAEKAGKVDVTGLLQYNPQHTGNRQQSSTKIINNRVTTTKNIIMTYSLTAGSAGRINLPPVDVTLDGKNYTTNPVAVNILKPGTTDQLDLKVTLSEQQCYVGQPVLITIKFYFSAEIRDPQFNIPVFRSNSFYFENPDILDQQAKEMDLGIGTTMLVSQHQVFHDGKQSNMIMLRKILIPRISGAIQIEPISVSTDVVVGRSRSRDSLFDSFFSTRREYKRFMVSSEPVNLTVQALPEQGKPSGFYGLVGQYTISASARPVKVNVGDPITLTIKVGGGKYLKPIQWPTLETISEIANNFKIPSEKASPVFEGGYKVFTQTIRASNDKVKEIGAIPLAYFDAETGKYEVAKTEAIKLDVSPTKILTNADLEGRGFDFEPLNTEVEAIKKGLSANYEDPEALINQTFSPLSAAFSGGYLVIWGGGAALVVLSGLIKFFTHTSPEKAAMKRRRTAAGQAIKQLKGISSSPERERYERLASVMKQYLGDRFDKTAGSLTSEDCFEVIVEATNNPEIANRFKEIVSECEEARYASSEGKVESAQITEVIKLIRNINKKSMK
jgi:hypothetical protein